MEDGTPLDLDTVAYFDSHVPEYGVDRLSDAASFISAHFAGDVSLIDIGAGTGNTLAYLRKSTGITNLAAVDVSGECLRLLRDQVDAETYQGSILDGQFLETIDRRFDFAIISAVLHHLIGKSRRQSRRYAEIAVENAKHLLRPGGHLIICEPVFSPSIAMSGVFYLKKVVTRLTQERVPLLGYWNNIGAPVVSFYTSGQVQELAQAGRLATLVHFHSEPDVPRLLNRLLDRSNVTLAVRLDT